MSNQNQVQAVQQEIAAVLQESLEVKASLAAAGHAGNEQDVKYFRGRLEQLDREKNHLREETNLLLRAQQGGAHCIQRDNMQRGPLLRLKLGLTAMCGSNMMYA